jgi:hypothetical protein
MKSLLVVAARTCGGIASTRQLWEGTSGLIRASSRLGLVRNGGNRTGLIASVQMPAQCVRWMSTENKGSSGASTNSDPGDTNGEPNKVNDSTDPNQQKRIRKRAQLELETKEDMKLEDNRNFFGDLWTGFLSGRTLLADKYMHFRENGQQYNFAHIALLYARKFYVSNFRET